LIDLDLGGAERGVEIAHRGVRRQPGVHRFRGEGATLACSEVEMPRLDGVGDIDEMRRCAGLFVGRGDDERHRVTTVMNVRAAQHRVGARIL
jgi:hypothetical protein